MTKTLEELGLEYMKEIELLNDKISACRKRLKTAHAASCNDEIYRIQRILSVFYKEKYELADTARKLLNYYS